MFVDRDNLMIDGDQSFQSLHSDYIVHNLSKSTTPRPRYKNIKNISVIRLVILKRLIGLGDHYI
jgi:hypothetical protein